MQSGVIKKSFVAGLSLSMLVLIVSACSKKITLNNSYRVPAARGFIKIKKDKNKNYAIDIKISNLAEAERLQAGMKVYIVWLVNDNEHPKNIGLINSTTKTLSKKLSAEFHSVSPVKPDKVFITAEEDGSVEHPGDFVVLSTEGI
jgi:hypothetical protein